MNKLAQWCLVSAMVIVGGCLGIGTEEAPVVQTAGSMPAVCGPKWVLKRLRLNGEVAAISDASRFTFMCSVEGNVMGKSGVNTYRGSLQVTDNGLLLWDTASFASTKMAGPDDLMQQERNYLRALSGTRQAFTKSAGARLILRDPSGDIYIEYVKAGI